MYILVVSAFLIYIIQGVDNLYIIIIEGLGLRDISLFKVYYLAIILLERVAYG
jgi:hypothetical protein